MHLKFQEMEKTTVGSDFFVDFAGINLNYLHRKSEVSEQRLRSWFQNFKAKDVSKLDYSS